MWFLYLNVSNHRREVLKIVIILLYFSFIGISTSLNAGFLGETENTKGLIFFMSIILFSSSSHTARNGKNTNSECIFILLGFLKSNKSAFAFFLLVNMSPESLLKKLHSSASMLILFFLK